MPAGGFGSQVTRRRRTVLCFGLEPSRRRTFAGPRSYLSEGRPHTQSHGRESGRIRACRFRPAFPGKAGRRGVHLGSAGFRIIVPVFHKTSGASHMFLIRFLAPLILAVAVSASDRVLRVGEGGEFAALGAALEASDSGDVILVSAGTYPETGLIVRKPVAIRGEGFPVLDARGGPTILDIRADGVEVSGL